jgi:lysozyme
MQQIISTLKDLTTLSTTTYSNKQGDTALGYNHTLGIYNGQTCTLKEAEFWLYTDVNNLRTAINNLLTVTLNKHQERALVSLVHDISLATFAHSKLLRYLNNKQFTLAASCFLAYNTNKRAVSVAVLRRRQIEQNIFKLQVLA